MLLLLLKYNSLMHRGGKGSFFHYSVPDCSFTCSVTTRSILLLLHPCCCSMSMAQAAAAAADMVDEEEEEEEEDSGGDAAGEVVDKPELLPVEAALEGCTRSCSTSSSFTLSPIRWPNWALSCSSCCSCLACMALILLALFSIFLAVLSSFSLSDKTQEDFIPALRQPWYLQNWQFFLVEGVIWQVPSAMQK